MFGNITGTGKNDNGGGGTSSLVWKKLYKRISTSNFPSYRDCYIYILVPDTVTNFNSLLQHAINNGASDCKYASGSGYAEQYNSIPASGIYYKNNVQYKITCVSAYRVSFYDGTHSVATNRWDEWQSEMVLMGEGEGTVEIGDFVINNSWSVVNV